MNYSKLKGRIVEIFGNQKNFAKAIRKSERTVSLKLNNKIFWTQEDIEEVVKALNLTTKDIPDYFFSH